MNITQVLEAFPPDLRTPVQSLCEWMREERGVSREDFSELKAIVADLAEAQKDLTVAQQRTEARVEELADTQRRMSEDMHKMSEDMCKMSEDMRRGFKELRDSISALGSRWGIMTEGTFRATIEGILSRTGYTVERGYYGRREVDVVIKNGDHMLLEICSVLKKSDIPKLIASAEDYEAREGVRPRLLVAATRVPRPISEALRAAPREIELFSWDEENE
jgi:hypothetical protein